MTRKKIFKYIIGTFVLLYLSLDIYIYYKYNDSDTAKVLTWTTRIYSSIPADSIPDNIINAYGKVFSNSFTNKIYPDAIWWFLIAQRQRQTYVQLDLAYDIGHCNTVKLISIANQLDNRLTQKQCVFAYLSRFDFLNNARGIKKAAKLHYNKNIQDLNERECLELVIMTKNPSLFDKYRNQDKLDVEVNKVTGANTR
jgi:hypothetical protein